MILSTLYRNATNKPPRWLVVVTAILAATVVYMLGHASGKNSFIAPHAVQREDTLPDREAAGEDGGEQKEPGAVMEWGKVALSGTGGGHCDQVASMQAMISAENANCRSLSDTAFGWIVLGVQDPTPRPPHLLVWGFGDRCVQVYEAVETPIRERGHVSTYACMGGHRYVNEMWTMNSNEPSLIRIKGIDGAEFCLGVAAGVLDGGVSEETVTTFACQEGAPEQMWRTADNKMFLQGRSPGNDKFYLVVPDAPNPLQVKSVSKEEATAITFIPFEICDRPHNWILQPSRCPVRGHLIEELDPVHDFRRGVVKGLVEWGEDKQFLLPWLLAARDPGLQAAPRKVLLDLGANVFDSSTRWFLEMYPLAFDEIHAFEVNKGMFVKPKSTAFNPILPFTQEVLDRITIHEGVLVSHEDGWGKLNITRFMLEELRLRPEDAVIVKMDVETAEWQILPAWLSAAKRPGSAVHVVDELFVEFHYAEPSMHRWGWDQEFIKAGKHKADVLEVLMGLRGEGVFAHVWP